MVVALYVSQTDTEEQSKHSSSVLGINIAFLDTSRESVLFYALREPINPREARMTTYRVRKTTLSRRISNKISRNETAKNHTVFATQDGLWHSFQC